MILLTTNHRCKKPINIKNQSTHNDLAIFIFQLKQLTNLLKGSSIRLCKPNLKCIFYFILFISLSLPLSPSSSSDMDCSKLPQFSFSASKILFICNQSLHSLNPISLSTTLTAAHSLCHLANEIIHLEHCRPKPPPFLFLSFSHRAITFMRFVICLICEMTGFRSFKQKLQFLQVLDMAVWAKPLRIPKISQIQGISSPQGIFDFCMFDISFARVADLTDFCMISTSSRYGCKNVKFALCNLNSVVAACFFLISNNQPN